MKNRITTTIGFLALIIGIHTSSFAQEAGKKSKKQIVRNSVYFSTAETGPNSLSLNVKKLKSNDGYVMLVLSDEKGKQIAVTKAPIIDKKCSVNIDSLQSGKYAVQYYHDKNSNGKLDTGAMGIPEEGYGSSNDARGFMGPPDFQDMILT